MSHNPNLKCPITKEGMIKRLRGIADSLENGESVPDEFSYSTTLNEGKYRYVFGIQVEGLSK